MKILSYSEIPSALQSINYRHVRKNKYFVKIVELKQLLFIKLNQKKLRSEEYIPLRDVISNDGDISNIEKMTILSAMYTGNSRRMYEYTQNAITYVQKYGRADLLITFTCNPV